ncbi:hypothetical protein IEN85_10860 [Pelagicoccus sp. NFK12]|uniref:Uncharacterized protein n=1 Tax=Pelagicoccus enzymogenes TaxID=2773457 RepID=A0A927IHN4_9BACT|nr:hypothetical protein [Pelagicoccus enzymogenes]MBD5779984.1 hypothetical protein [Pelagicoccus enzymogenes]MBD5779986.1 hypothetical protein [Pelagicoccus enzymogenes]MBD5779989.1 hypothetical protein [Pelagicoccus enzymogenes]
MNDLIPYLFRTKCYGGIPFGVTARSKEKALEIIQKEGYEIDVEADIEEVIENVSFHDIKERYIKERMGPIVCEGMWYPVTKL